MVDKSLSVSEVVDRIKCAIVAQVDVVQVEAEISNLTCSGAGHYYFTLSDNESSIGCALFKTDASKNQFIRKLKNGDKILCLAHVDIYQKRGTLQLIVKKLWPVGDGYLLAQFLKLKDSLEKEGLFLPSNKRSIPDFPQKVAIISAKNGAALQDFITVFSRRSYFQNLLLINSLVQGDRAPDSVIESLKLILEYNKKSTDSVVEVVVIARGGGSMEDLWAFNSEALIRYVATYPIPVISAIGHQTDFTLLDFVSDLRAETPTAAAELLTIKQMELKNRLTFLHSSLLQRSRQIIINRTLKLKSLSPKVILMILKRRVEQAIFKADDLSMQAQRLIVNKLDSFVNRLEQSRIVLDVLNPNAVLERGFSIVTDSKNKVVSLKEKMERYTTSEIFNIKFLDGVTKVQKNRENE